MRHSSRFSPALFWVTSTVSISTICGREFTSSAGLYLLLTVTPITMSAPISLHTSTGKLSCIPPSISTLSPILTGAKTPGMAIDARMHCGSTPWRKLTCSPVTISVATQAKGMGNLSKSISSLYPTQRLLSRLRMLLPLMKPPGRVLLILMFFALLKGISVQSEVAFIFISKDIEERSM